MKNAGIVFFVLALAACAAGNGAVRNGGEMDSLVEKITVTNGAVPVYRFTVPEGDAFGNYTRLRAEFLVDAENYGKQARLRAYGNYPFEHFSDSGDIVFLDFGGGDTDKNGPYLVSNVIGSEIDMGTVSDNAGANVWFTVEFPLYGKRHQNYQAANFPANDASGEFYFGLGLGTGDADTALSYYIREVTLLSNDGSKKIVSQGSGFENPAFAGYAAAIPELSRAPADAIAEAAVAAEASGPVEINVDTSVRYQRVTGFGGMSNAWTSPVLTEDDITTMYGENGLGYNIFRIIIYHEPEKWGELLPLAKKAQSYGALILASPWTPPAGLKSNNSNIGGHLLPENYAKYAEHLASFVRYMADNGVKIDVISLQNEPDIQVSYDSCDWTPEQMLDFVKNHGRAIGDVKIIPGESFQFRRVFTDPLLNDTGALENFDIIGGHIYGGGLKAYPAAREKGKDVWMTEHLFNTHGNYPYDLTWPAAMTVAKEIHACMLADFNAYLWWYLKRFYGMLGDGENGAADGAALRRGYVMSHYAKFAAGKQRVEAGVTGNKSILVSAYETEEDISLVIINTGNTPSEAKINLPVRVENCAGLESDENSVMRNIDVNTGFGRKTVSLNLGPQSIVSLRCGK